MESTQDKRQWLDGLLRVHENRFGGSIRSRDRRRIDVKTQKVSKCKWCLRYFSGEYEFCSYECYNNLENEYRIIQRINGEIKPNDVTEENELFEDALGRNKKWQSNVNSLLTRMAQRQTIE